MFDALYKVVARFATWPVIALLFIAYVLATQGFEARHAALGYDTRILDVRFAYSPDDARAFFEELGARGRNLYALTEVTLDLIFPLIYNGLLAILIFNLWNSRTAKYLLLVPLLTAAADLLENVTIASLAWTFDGHASPVAWAASAFTSAKLLFGALSFIVVVIGAVWGVWDMWRSKDAIR